MNLNTDHVIPRNVRTLLGDQAGSVAALSATSGLTGFAEAAIFAIVAEVASALVTGDHSIRFDIGPASPELTVSTMLAIGLAVALLRVALGFAGALLPPRIAGRVQATLRANLLQSFMHASWAVQSQDREGHFQETMTSQAMQASQAAAAAAAMIGLLFTFLIMLVIAVLLNPVAVLVILAMSGLLFGVLQPLRSAGRESAGAFSAAQLDYANAIGELNRVAEETKVFGVTSVQEHRAKGHIDRAGDLFIRTQSILYLIPTTYQSMLFLLIMVGLIGAYAVSPPHVSTLGAVVLLLIRAGSYGQQVQAAHQTMQQAMPFVARVKQVEDRYAASRTDDEGEALPRISSMAFEGVSFAYQPESSVLSDLTFEVQAGEAIGIVGPSGAGKSSTVQILLGLREPTAGEYLVNGVPAGKFDRGDWHSRVAYVPQEPRLIHATVADNIRYYRDLDDDAVRRAAELAHIHEDIVGWQSGYDTVIGPRADAISGGQRQRICLARALAGDPEVLILDEPTSALDPRSEMLVRESLEEIKYRMTIFVVAHGSVLLDVCNRVMVIVGGRLEAFEDPQELEKESAYQRSVQGLGLAASDRNSESLDWEKWNAPPA